MNLDNLNDLVNTVKASEAMGKANEILNVVKAGEILKRKEEEEKRLRKKRRAHIAEMTPESFLSNFRGSFQQCAPFIMKFGSPSGGFRNST